MGYRVEQYTNERGIGPLWRLVDDSGKVRRDEMFSQKAAEHEQYIREQSDKEIARRGPSNFDAPEHWIPASKVEPGDEIAYQHSGTVWRSRYEAELASNGWKTVEKSEHDRENRSRVLTYTDGTKGYFAPASRHLVRRGSLHVAAEVDREEVNLGVAPPSMKCPNHGEQPVTEAWIEYTKNRRHRVDKIKLSCGDTFSNEGGSVHLAVQHTAHDAGDGETIFHCPMCGSGAVVGRSDGTVECDMCFSGETTFITWDGIRTLKETVGTTQRLLVSKAQTKRSNGKSAQVSVFGGRWVDAEIRSFGVQPLLRVVLRRQGVEKVVHATAEHRWWTTPFVRNEGYTYATRVVTQTQHLQSGDRLIPLFPTDRLRQNRPTTPSPFGIAHGFVFGDGSLTTHGGAHVTLFGEKDGALAPYFAASKKKTITNEFGTTGEYIRDLPEFFKELPSFNESLSYLYGWLAGYFAADGSVSKSGGAQLDCHDPEILEQVRTLCSRLGIGTYTVRSYERLGYDRKQTGLPPSNLSRLSFVASTLTPDFFVIPEHRARFEGRSGQREAVAWMVASVEKTDRIEEVYCAVVPKHENFTLEDNINVMNCDTVFTVQVQPKFPNMPQTLNGVPINDPSTPGVPPAPMWQDPGGYEAPTNPGFEQGVPQEVMDQDADWQQGQLDRYQAPSFLAARYVANGVALNEEQFLRHTALKYAEDRAGVLAQIQDERKTQCEPSG